MYYDYLYHHVAAVEESGFASLILPCFVHWTNSKCRKRRGRAKLNIVTGLKKAINLIWAK